MPDIHVIFQSGGSTIVHSDPTPVMQNECVYWLIHNQNPNVDGVRITFASPTATFFPQKSGPPRSSLAKPLSEGNTLWGRAPAYIPPGGPVGSRDDKYTVEGLDAGGNLVPGTTLDPTIRIDGP